MSSRTIHRITPEMRDQEFAGVLMKRLGEKGQKLPLCLQCGVCSGSCPVMFAMDYTPRQLMELIKLGLKDEVLDSSTIWMCAACHSCSVRCPQGVDLKQVMETLKEMAIEDPTRGRAEKKFYKAFVQALKEKGRMNEIGLYVKLMPRSALATNLGFGVSLYRKGKIKLIPQKAKNLDQVARIFEKTQASDEERAV